MSFLRDTQYGERHEIPGIGFYITNLLSPEECSTAISLFDVDMEEIRVDKSYRDMSQTTLLSDELSNKLWARISHHFNNITITSDNEFFYGPSFNIKGTWTPQGLNNYFRCSRYKP